MSRTGKVFLACALGAFIGALVALEVGFYLWWLGLLAGGFAGYLAYDFRRVIEAIPKAWAAATSWRPNWARVRLYPKLVLYLTILFSSIWPLLFLLPLKERAITVSLAFSIFQILVSLIYLSLIIGIIGAAVVVWDLKEDEEKRLSRLIRHCNFFTIYFWYIPRFTLVAIWWILRKIAWLVVHIPDGLRVIGRFVWALFRTIHSDERLLCGVDAAIGAGIGYLAGNALIGALAGGVIGVVNYELISKRLLNLVPIRNGG